MKVLGIDTSGYANAVGVVDNKKILADFTFKAKTDSLEKIVTHIDFVLKSAGLTLAEIQGFGIGLGPGSWTGIRVGVTVGKVLAYSTAKSVCGVPTLEVLAFNARDVSSLICPVISTGTGDTVYAACYRSQQDSVTRVGEYYVGEVKGLSAMINEPINFVGSDVQKYKDLISQVPGLTAGIETLESAPKGSSVALLAAMRLERGESDDALALAPLYLKESTARAFQNKYLKSVQTKG